ncbi:MAG: toxin-antitoxin system YwqK family antitoxin [Bacteroidetes bacterium]|nr:toxin-antitoxin system YwqK family antitoxin [Bacteroidota bacterium]
MKKICFILSIAFTFALHDARAQRDSCSCISLTPIPDFFYIGEIQTSYYNHNEIIKRPYTGVCHTYYMAVAYVQPDYSRTYQHGEFKDGALEYYVSFNQHGDTIGYFHRVKEDSIFAETKRFNYQSGRFEAREIYYYSHGGKFLRVYAYNFDGEISSITNYFYPEEGDSLNYWGNYRNYKKDSRLTADGFYSIPVQDGPYYEYGGKVLTAQGQYHNNYKSGEWKRWYASGKLKSDENYSSPYGFRNGRWREWYENGQLKADIDYCNDQPSANFKEWYENGQPKTVAAYSNWKLNGDYFEYWPDGSPKKKAFYKNGFPIGKDEEWFENGKPAASYNYSDSGRYAGRQATWWDNGNLKTETIRTNGNDFTQTDRDYWENGKLREETQTDKYGRFIGKWTTYYESGILEKEENYLKYTKSGICKYYYSNGKLRVEENYLNGGLNGNCKYFREDGTLRCEISYKNYQRDGKCYWYFPDAVPEDTGGKAKVWREFNYTNDVRSGRCKEWNSAGELVYEQDFMNGEPVGPNHIAPVRTGANVDSVRAIYKTDAKILETMNLNDGYSNFNSQLYPSDSAQKKLLSVLVSIYYFIPPEIDTARLVHYDSLLKRTHVYLDYPWTPKRPGDTSSCAGTGSWPPQLDKIISEMHFKPVFDECYGDDNGGIRRGFTSDINFNDRAFDSLLKKMNPRYGCEYFSPSMPGEYDNITRSYMTSHAGTGYTDVDYFYFFPHDKSGLPYYLNWTFRVYDDGSVDLLGYTPQRVMYAYRIPE